MFDSLTVSVFAVAVVVAAAFFPSFGLAVFMFFVLLFPKLPLIQIQGYMVPIRIEDVLLVAVLLALLIRHYFNHNQRLVNPLQKPMVIYLVTTAVSLVFGLLILHSIPAANIGFLFWLRTPEYFAASYLCLLGIENWKQYKRAFATLVFFTFLIGVYGVLQEYSLVPAFDAMHQTDELVVIRFLSGFAEERLFSTFAGPYDLAAFYLIAIPILFAWLFIAKSKVLKIALGAVLAISLLCFYLSYARVPLVALGLALFVCAWSLGYRRTSLILAPVALLPALLIGGFAERLSDAAYDPLASSAMGIRIDTSWFDAIASFFRSPLLGTGPASLGDAVGVDGLYILLLGTGGALGLICFLLLIFRAVRYQKHSIRDTGNELQKALGLGLFAGTIALLVNGFTQDTFFNSKVAFTYWFLMGLLLVGRRLEARSLYFARAPVPVMNFVPSAAIQPATSGD
jgi:hypothetical protein